MGRSPKDLAKDSRPLRELYELAARIATALSPFVVASKEKAHPLLVPYLEPATIFRSRKDSTLVLNKSFAFRRGIADKLAFLGPRSVYRGRSRLFTLTVLSAVASRPDLFVARAALCRSNRTPFV
jgi:hypothetical protein